MEQLLDFSKPVDLALLEQTIRALYAGTDRELAAKADKVLTALKQSDTAWQSAGDIVEKSSDLTTKIFALSILEEAVKVRWKALPQEQRQGIRNFIVWKIVNTASNEATVNDQRQKPFVNKLNLVLVQILKHEWPNNWPEFIPEIVGSSSKSEILCENNMQVLKLLSEEVFEFSKEEMKSEKVKEMKQRLNGEFRQIFELCQLVLTSSQRPGLIKITLETLLRFLAWIPLGYIFETPLIEQLLSKFLPNNMFRNETLACLTEIANIQDSKYTTIFQNMFNAVMNILQQQLPPSTDIPAEYERAAERECLFIQGLSLFFSSFFTKHMDIMEKPENYQACLTAMLYLVSISMVDEKEIFKICLEFWNRFAKELLESERRPMGMSQKMFGDSGPLNLGGGFIKQEVGSRAGKYEEVLSRVRTVMISRMAKPEEVLVVEDDDGNIIREIQKDTDAIAQYKTMRDTLVYLTHLNVADTEKIMLLKLSLQCDPNENEFSWNNLNTLCWAIGSISGTMSEDDEKKFLVIVIKDLLNLCEMKRGKDNKAVVASNIMYVVGQYPRFLRVHWKFLKTVVKKLFEFMHEFHPGVQDMACDTFLKISQKCSSKFVALQRSETRPFIDELLEEITATTRDLSANQQYTFFEAVGYMIREQENEGIRTRLLENLMGPSAMVWKNLMQQGSQNTQSLLQYENIEKLANVLRMNVHVCTAMGYTFRPHLMTFYLDMLHVYKFYSTTISQSVVERGEIIVQHKEFKGMRLVKGEILKLIEIFISKSDNAMDVANTFCPPLVEPILDDYQQSVTAGRSADVLQLFVVVVNKLKGDTNRALDGTLVEKILSPIFNPTLEMITTNFTDWPDHRMNFFKLIKALNLYCFERLFSVPPETQKNIINSIVWAFKHTERGISELGLEIMEKVLQNVASAPDQFSQPFYSSYYLSVLQDILYVLTDRLHKSSIGMHGTILKHLFAIVVEGRVKVPLGGQAGGNNQQFLQQYVSNMIAGAFPNVSKRDVEQFVIGLSDQSKDIPAFKAHLRDFLITITEFCGDDADQLFAQDKEEQERAKQQQQLRERAAIPGLLTQREQDEMADL